MPELPEVETIVRDLNARLAGLAITEVTVHWPGSIDAPDPRTFVQLLTGRTLTGVHRRGKWVIIDLDDGQTLLVHLRMTGQLVLESKRNAEDKYARLTFSLDNGQRLRFSDMRKFGRLILTRDPSDVLGGLGPEPLADDFTVQRFESMLASRRGRIKSLLLDQQFLAGLGNIYVNEALWRACIHPLRSADSLTTEEVARLHRAIRSVLGAAIDEGGTTLENGNFRRADGAAGEYASQLLAYGRAEEPCAGCGTAIERIVVGQRSTYYCPKCQPPPADECASS
jgi:formamidopyrimidine-DNA glycosylase